MKKLKNYTESEVLDIIDEVSSRYAARFSFGYYDEEDIKQEAFIISLEALEKYDEERPLENFLAVHIKNKLITFIRNNYYRTDYVSEKGRRVNESKKNIMDTIDILAINSENENNMVGKFNHEAIHRAELLQIIDDNLFAEFREDYCKYIDGFKLTSAREANLIEHLKEIVREYYAECW